MKELGGSGCWKTSVGQRDQRLPGRAGKKVGPSLCCPGEPLRLMALIPGQWEATKAKFSAVASGDVVCLLRSLYLGPPGTSSRPTLGVEVTVKRKKLALACCIG